MKIFGKNVSIPPTPAMIPSTTNEMTISPAPSFVNKSNVPLDIQSKNISKYPFRKSPKVKVKKNTNAMIPRKIGTPK